VEPEEFEVVGEARDGVEAVRQFEVLRPDLVLLDLVMPRRSGIEALKRIRRIDPGACVVVCAALGQEPLAVEAALAGAADSVVKPFHPHQLVSTLRRVLRKRLVPARQRQGDPSPRG
jgi:two-component system chemotaxis response regulator CheY